MKLKLVTLKSTAKSVLLITTTLVLFIGSRGIAQINQKPVLIIPEDVYEQKKVEGKLSSDYNYQIIKGEHATPQAEPVQDLIRNNSTLDPTVSQVKTASSCNCLIPNVNTDATFTKAEFSGYTAPDYRNDDGSTLVKTMPFNFCMYGTNYNQFYINNNGNISFGSSFATYTSTGFPSTQYVMVAPFWADVDTRNTTSGVVYYKITPTAVIVQWYRVGYFASMADKLNTFQCIITDGTDPIIANGNNVAFCYGTMEWTTGSASGGSGGFGGTPATVGVNKGDGVNYAQVGRFGQAGNVYNGPVSVSPSSGVSWLNNQSFYFNTCASTNIPPISAGAGLNNCDTIKVCSITDSVTINAVFLSPEAGQITSISVNNTTGNPGVTTISNTSGNVASAQVRVVASILNAGLNIITFTATDNGTPVGTSVINAQVYVDTTGFVVNNMVLNGVLSLCQGAATALNVTPTNASSYTWTPSGSTATSITVTTPGPISVTSSINGCIKTINANIIATYAAGFSYVGSPFCQNVPNPSPVYVTNGGPGTFTFTPAGLSIDAATGIIDLAGSQTGTYTITNTIAATADCPSVNASTTITITPAPVSTFNYAGSPYCHFAGAVASPTFINGGFAGTFTSVPAGLIIDPVTGNVDAELSQPGTYIVTNTIPAQGGCADAISSSLISILAPAEATFTYIGNPFCHNAFNPTPFFIGGGVAGTFSAPPGLVIVPSTGAINLAQSTPGTYTVTNTLPASGPCPPIVATFDVTITEVPVATFSYVGNPFCQSGGVDPSPTFSGTGVGGVFTSSPSGLSIDGSGNVTSSTSLAGTYTVTNTIAAAGGCPAVSASTTIVISPTPDGFFTYPADPYCQNAGTAFPALNPGGTAGTFSEPTGNLSINPTTGEVNLAASVPGFYTVFNDIASITNCPAIQASATITITEMPIVSFSYPGNPFCQSAITASPIFTSQMGFIYSNDPSIVIDIFSGTIDLVSSLPGTYTIYNFISASGGCPDAVDSAIVSIVSVFDAAFSYTGDPYCQSTATVNPTYTNPAGVAGVYSSSPSGLIINPATGAVDLSSPAATYTVTNSVMSSGGCVGDTATATITISPLPVSTFSYTGNPYCASGPNPIPTFTNGGTPGTFSSTLGLNFVSTTTGEINLATSTPGTYTVTNTVGGGLCPASITSAIVTISSQFAAGFSYTATPYCQNAANPAPALNPGATAGTFTSTPTTLVFVSTTTGVVDLAGSPAGTYTVTNTVPGSGACASVNASTQITITQTPIATFSYTASPYCQNLPNPSPTFSSGGFAGTFSEPTGNLSINPTTGVVDLVNSLVGTYTVTNSIAATGGCPAATATATITINPAPLANFSYTGTPYCQASVNPFPTFGTGAVAGTFTATNSGTNVLIINPSTGNVDVQNSPPGTYTVTNTIPATGGCGASVSTSPITIVAQNIAGFSYTSPVCINGTNPQPIFVPNGSAGTFTVAPTTLSFVSTSTGVVDLSASSAGNYTITNSIPANACPASSASTTLTITALPVATFAYPATPYCQNDPNPSPAISAGGTAGTFSGPTGVVFVSSSSGQVNLGSSTPGTYIVTNTVPAALGCPAVTATATITINPMQNAAFAYSSGTYCRNGNTPAPTTSVPNGTFSSTTGLTFVNTTTGVIDAANSTSGTYSITYTTPGPCANSSTQIINIADSPVANAGPNQIIDCHIGSTTLNGGASSSGGTISYSWAGPGIVSGGNTTNPVVNTTGTYTLTVTNSLTPQCPAVDTVHVGGVQPSVAVITTTPNPAAGTPPLTVNFSGANSTNNPTSYLWSFSGGTPNSAGTMDATSIYSTTGNYVAYLTVTNLSGCVTVDSVEITVYDAYSLVIPNTFSPNGDGINELFSPYFDAKGVQSLTGTIYDRWGLKLFTWNGVEGGWDGRTTSGNKAAEGTYYYTITSTGFDGSTHEDKGFVTLFR